MADHHVKAWVCYRDDILVVYRNRKSLVDYMRGVTGRLAVAYELKLECASWTSVPMLDLRVGKVGA
jgi:hypothetical protein